MIEDRTTLIIITSITAFFSLLSTVAGIFLTWWLSRLNRKVEDVHEVAKKAVEQTEEVVRATNGMKEQLMLATAEASRAQGQLEGAASEQARVAEMNKPSS